MAARARVSTVPITLAPSTVRLSTARRTSDAPAVPALTRSSTPPALAAMSRTSSAARSGGLSTRTMSAILVNLGSSSR